MSELRNFQNEKKLHWQSYETKSREDLTDLQNQEFYTSPDSLIERMKTGKFDRSTFLKLMGASMAMTTLNCVRKPVEKIIPYVNAPEEVKHGHSLFYSSTCRTCSAGCGVLVRSKDGRPLKLEGNPDHIGSRGGLCASGQVSIFDLYDPERTREPMMLSKGDAKKSDWKSLDEAVKKALTANPGKTRILTSPINSPTAREVLEKFLAANGGGEIVEFSATGAEEAIALASEKSYGRSVVPNYHFDRARVVVSIDADFLGTWISPVEFTKQFAGRRKIKSDTGEINTYYAIESVPTVTGSNADARLAIKPGDQRKAAFALALALAELGAGVPAAVSAYKLDTLCSELGVPKASFQKVAKELWAAKGASLIVAGGVSASTEDAVELQVAVNMLNSILGNDGITVNHASPRAEGVNYTGNLKKLVSELKSKSVGVLFITNLNPAYQLPNLKWKELLGGAALTVSLSDRVDETAGLSNWLAPTSHFLESWGDVEAVKGVVSIQQPAIRPLFDTRSVEESFMKWTGIESSYYELLKSKYTARLGGNRAWEDFLRLGIIPGTQTAGTAGSRGFNGASVSSLGNSTKGLSLSLYETVGLGDGSGANNSLRQELPDPISKITWDNYVAISPTLATEKGLKSNDVVAVSVNGKKIDLPVQIQPGMHKEAVGIAIGYGRTAAGSVGNGIGVNTYELAKLNGGLLQYSGLSVSLEKTGKTYKLASTQDHHMMNPTAVPGQKPRTGIAGSLLKPYAHERPLIYSQSFADWKKQPKTPDVEIPNIKDGKGNIVKSKGMNDAFIYGPQRWGLSIDLTLCTGCSACVVACQVENNIPVVGRDEVRVGREMHWLRIDRYYIGNPEEPETMAIAHQPVMCQHCENAPCETVCPVAATVHGNEGTNDMVYNRCVGTRYCSNNCPYKVRRFNWMNHWNGKDTVKAPRYLGFNPDVTVRSRGVMEKCTFCNSRIAEKRIAAKNAGRDTVKDGDLKTACQESCPADAITFGNINDPKSIVSGSFNDKRSYKILEFINTIPSVTYLSRVRNSV